MYTNVGIIVYKQRESVEKVGCIYSSSLVEQKVPRFKDNFRANMYVAHLNAI